MEAQFTDEEIIKWSRDRIADLPQVCAVLDGNEPDQFLVIAIADDFEAQKQCLTLSIWDVEGPLGQTDSELMIPIMPQHLPALAYAFEGIHKALIEEGAIPDPKKELNS